MSFRKICKVEEEKNQKYIKGLQDTCTSMRTMLRGMGVEPSSSKEKDGQTDDELMEDDYEQEKKIDEQFLRHKEMLEKYKKATSEQTQNFEILRLNFSKIIGIILRVDPSLSSLDLLEDHTKRDSIHKRMDKIGLHAFYQKAGVRRFPLIMVKLKSVMKTASEVMFDQSSLGLGLTFNEKIRILKHYYKMDAKSGSTSSPLRISGKGLLTVIDSYLTEHRSIYKRSRQMRKLLKEYI